VGIGGFRAVCSPAPESDLHLTQIAAENLKGRGQSGPNSKGARANLKLPVHGGVRVHPAPAGLTVRGSVPAAL
jgi:hypothetical protein